MLGKQAADVILLAILFFSEVYINQTEELVNLEQDTVHVLLLLKAYYTLLLWKRPHFYQTGGIMRTLPLLITCF